MALSPLTVKKIIEEHTGLPAPEDGEGGVSVGGWVRVAYHELRLAGRAGYAARSTRVTQILEECPGAPLPERMGEMVGREIVTLYDAKVLARIYAEIEGVEWSPHPINMSAI